jgi:hypothetical protein
MGCVLFRAFILPTHYVTLTAAFLFVTLSFPSNLSIKMGGTDRRGILFYGGSIPKDIGLPQLFLHDTILNIN